MASCGPPGRQMRRRRGTMSGTAPILWYIGMGVIHWEAGGARQEYMQNQWGKAARPQPALAPPGSGTRGRCSTVRVPIKVTTISGRFEILDTFMGRHSGRCPEQPRERTTKIPKNQNRPPWPWCPSTCVGHDHDGDDHEGLHHCQCEPGGKIAM